MKKITTKRRNYARLSTILILRIAATICIVSSLAMLIGEPPEGFLGMDFIHAMVVKFVATVELFIIGYLLCRLVAWLSP